MLPEPGRSIMTCSPELPHGDRTLAEFLPSRPGDFHPEALTDPDVNLSIHPARATPRKPTGFRQDEEFLRLPVDSILTRVTCPLRSAGITPLLHYYEAVRPWLARR